MRDGNSTSGISIHVWHGSIGDADADVLVNASNTTLRLGAGVSAAIRASCGPGFQGQLDAFLRANHPDGLEPGAVVITDAGAHPRARYVAHVAVMDYRDLPGVQVQPDRDRIARGCRALWQRVAALDASNLSVGMVALGAGTGGMGLRDSVGIACQTLAQHLAGGAGAIGSVCFAAYQRHEYINTLAVVRRHFDVDISGLDAEARALLRSLEREA